MAYSQMFFVQTFGINRKNQIIPGPIFHAIDAADACAKAELFSHGRTGVIAFSQMVDEKAEDSEEPILLALYGCVPAEARAA